MTADEALYSVVESQQCSVLDAETLELTDTYIKPMDIKTPAPILDFLLICTPHNIQTGKRAKPESTMMAKIPYTPNAIGMTAEGKQ